MGISVERSEGWYLLIEGEVGKGPIIAQSKARKAANRIVHALNSLPLEPSPRVRASVRAVQDNTPIHEECGSEATAKKRHNFGSLTTDTIYFCHGCDREYYPNRVITVEQARDVLVAYAISTIDRWKEQDE